jgi:hypothetical protein
MAPRDPRAATTDQPRSGRVRPRRSLLLLIAALAVFILGTCSRAASARAAFPIERVWSFNGGEVAIQSQPGGTFVGTVIAATKFAECSHAVGEQMWTGITLQPDGSYWGLHQWFLEGPACVPNHTPGQTAWRVIESAGGGHYLLVCFSEPGNSQPTIDPGGAAANVSYGCYHSAEIAPVPLAVAPRSRAGAQSFAQAVRLPSNKRCFSRRVLQIHLRDPRHDPLKEVIVTLRRRRVAVVRRGTVFAATITLKGLPRGTFTVKIRAITVLGHRLSGSRTYHTCATKPLRARRPKAKAHTHA